MQIEPALGRQVTGVTEARHWYAGRRDSGLLHFWLHFAGLPTPLMAHSSGDHVSLRFESPYAAYDMGEYGSTRVGPARAPDVLAVLPGRRLLDAALVGEVRLRFDSGELVIASVADEWVLTLV